LVTKDREFGDVAAPYLYASDLESPDFHMTIPLHC